MIRKIEFSNFYSFKNQQVLDFTTSKKKSSDYFTTYDGKQISKIIGVLGSNGSGKTNIMRLFSFLAYFFKSAERNPPEEYNTWFKSYAFSNSRNSEFSIEFETKEQLYFYELIMNPREVIKEKLTTKPLKKGAKFKQVFYRDKKKILLNKKFIKGVTSKQLKSIRKDVSTVAFIKANYEEQIINEIHNYFKDYSSNVNEIGSPYLPSKKAVLRAASFYNRFPSLQKKMEEIFRNFDLGIDGFEIDLKTDQTKINTYHNVQKKKYILPIQYESHGTRALFIVFALILNFINKGSVLVIDELEVGLHPQAVTKIIQYVIDSFKQDKKQFIFTSHSYDFLKRFDAQQIYLVEKKENVSEIFRLDELGVRPDENFLSKYMSGSYGAFPKIRI